MAGLNMYLVSVLAAIATLAAFMGVASGGRVDPVINYNVLRFLGGREAFQCRGKPSCPIQVCPKICKTRSITGAGNAACFMNCVTCSISCKHRKHSCVGYGAVCYDPRFIGGDGVMFYFHGQKDHDFCVVSDKNLHINAHFIGKRPDGRSRDYTWVQGLAMLFDSHKLGVSAKKVATWSDNVDQLAFSFDGEDVHIAEHEGALWTSPSGQVVIERTTNVNSVHVVIDQLMEVSLDVVPITAEDSRVHGYQISDDDCFAHLQMQFNFFHLSSAVDGVLGQTYRPDFQNPVKVGVPMPIMGGDDKFLTSSLFSADCKSTQFSTATVSHVDNHIRSFPVQCNYANGGLACRR